MAEANGNRAEKNKILAHMCPRCRVVLMADPVKIIRCPHCEEVMGLEVLVTLAKPDPSRGFM